MKIGGARESRNLEDRRRSSGKPAATIGGLGVLGIALVIWLLGGNPMEFLGIVGGEQGFQQQQSYEPTAEEDSLAHFVSVVLANTEEVWSKIFRQMGKTYREPKLVLYTRSYPSACGMAATSTGPFYCPGDEKVYIDLSFYQEMRDKLHAPGDFAFAYVIAHEIGHHVQKLLGTLDSVNHRRSRSNEKTSNALSVKIELQADFYAGLWAHHSDKMFHNLEKDDIEEAINAASSVGDDRVQKQATGHVVPDSFTHGTSEQRKRWFFKGYETGDIRAGDTFHSRSL